MNYQALEQALINLPEKATQIIIETVFMPHLFEGLGFNQQSEVFPGYRTGKGQESVDYALRHNKDAIDIFLKTQSNPFLLIEIKGLDCNLTEGTAQYKETVYQLKEYLLSPKCKSAQWGIITNSSHIQLFRKHGKVIYPATLSLEITPQNIGEIVKKIRHKIDNTPKALAVSIYNNKGGVGKTTTTVNLAAALTLQGKKVLIVDFDASQRDLTNSFNFKQKKSPLFSLLKDRSNLISVKDTLISYAVNFSNPPKTFSFDIIPCDKKLSEQSESELRKLLKLTRLRQVLDKVKFYYDYILIDSPPNWNFFSISSITASDVVLIPTKANNIYSLENAAITIASYIPEIQRLKEDGSPIALPIFWNGENITKPQQIAAYKAIDDIIERYKKDIDNQFNLQPYFYPQSVVSATNKHPNKIFEVPSYAYIANAAFSRIPAVYKNKTAYNCYSELAKEYFLQ